MMVRASTVGELAAELLSRGGQAEVTRAFPNSVYLRSGDDFVVMLRGELRSPLTINLEKGKAWPGFRPGETCELSSDEVVSEGGTVDMRRAAEFRSSLAGTGALGLPSSKALAAWARMLRSLYDLAPSGPILLADPELRGFVRRVLVPLSRGERSPVGRFESYMSIIGRGGGFTPAGDDFVGGFAATYNFVAHGRRWKRIVFPRGKVSTLTIPESASMMSHAADGYVDELVERLIVRSTSGTRVPFHREILAVAHRGHTSGLDTSLGTLLCEAALAEQAGESGALGVCLGSLWKP